MGSDCSWVCVSFWSDEHVLELVVMLPNSVNILTATECTLYMMNFMVCQLHLNYKNRKRELERKGCGRLLTLTWNIHKRSHFFLPATVNAIDRAPTMYQALFWVLQTIQTQSFAPMDLTFWWGETDKEHNK